MPARLERILEKLAQQRAPHLIPPGWKMGGSSVERIRTLARKLAAYDVLVMVVDVPQELDSVSDAHLQEWVRGYARFYQLLVQGLFPSLQKLSAYYADKGNPPAIVLDGESTPVMEMFAGYIIPYVAAHQSQKKDVSELELRGLMDFVLNELEARNLPPSIYEQMRQNGVELIKKLLQSPIRQISLTAFDKPIFEVSAPPPIISKPPPGKLPGTGEVKLPEAGELTYELERLPDDDQPQTPTEQMFINKIPLRVRGNTGRLPPLPPLLNQDVDEE
jgi:hypothetical protein